MAAFFNMLGLAIIGLYVFGALLSLIIWLAEKIWRLFSR